MKISKQNILAQITANATVGSLGEQDNRIKMMMHRMTNNQAEVQLDLPRFAG
jgi:hypothetical protein